MALKLERINHYFDLNDYDHSLNDGGLRLSGDDLKYHELLVDIMRLSLALQLDFGAIDVVKSDEGQYYIIDVNATPNWGRENYSEILSFLSGGLPNN